MAFTSCEISVLTVNYVNQCPTDSESWQLAAKRMNCEGIEEDCQQGVKTDSHQFVFQYHCVINVWRNATLEVCAFNRTILDKNFHNLYILFFRTHFLIFFFIYKILMSKLEQISLLWIFLLNRLIQNRVESFLQDMYSTLCYVTYVKTKWWKNIQQKKVHSTCIYTYDTMLWSHTC